MFSFLKKCLGCQTNPDEGNDLENVIIEDGDEAHSSRSVEKGALAGTSTSIPSIGTTGGSLEFIVKELSISYSYSEEDEQCRTTPSLELKPEKLAHSNPLDAAYEADESSSNDSLNQESQLLYYHSSLNANAARVSSVSTGRASAGVTFTSMPSAGWSM